MLMIVITISSLVAGTYMIRSAKSSAYNKTGTYEDAVQVWQNTTLPEFKQDGFELAEDGFPVQVSSQTKATIEH